MMKRHMEEDETPEAESRGDARAVCLQYEEAGIFLYTPSPAGSYKMPADIRVAGMRRYVAMRRFAAGGESRAAACRLFSMRAHTACSERPVVKRHR